MNDFLEQIWWGNPVRNYLIIVSIILFTWLLKRFISRYLAGLIYGIVHKIWKDVDKHSFISLVMKPLGFFLAVLISIITLYKLNFPQEINVDIYKYTVKEIFQCFGNIVLIISFTSLLIRIIDFIALILEKRANLTADQTDNQLIVFFRDFFKAILVIIGIMLVFKYAFGLNVGGLITGLSIVGAAIALALRESLENLIASFIIFFDKPFTAGDLLKVNTVTGIVEKIGLRSTRIRTEQKTFVTVPNKQMVDSVVDNLSLRTQRRGELKLELSPATPGKTIAAFKESVSQLFQQKYKQQVESFSAFLQEVNKNGFVIVAEYFTAPVSIDNFNELKQNINFDIISLIEQHQVCLASSAAVVITGQPGHATEGSKDII
jgi:MscS family membrane protein